DGRLRRGRGLSRRGPHGPCRPRPDPGWPPPDRLARPARGAHDRTGDVRLRGRADTGVGLGGGRAASRRRAGEGGDSMKVARRLENLPPYLFAQLDKRVAEKRASGADVISLGVGDPDLPTPSHVVAALQEAARDPSTHQYPSYYGMPELRRAIAQWYRTRFDV